MNQPKEIKNLYIELQSVERTDVIIWYHAPYKNRMHSDMTTLHEQETYMCTECIDDDH